MVSSELNPSGAFDDFTAKAFLIALARFEGTLSPTLVAEINEVGSAITNGQLSQVANLRVIARKDDDFYKAYKLAYQELQALDKSEERNKWLPELKDDEPPRETEGIENFLAPPLKSHNPQSEARGLFASIGNLVARIYQLKF